MTKTLRYLNSLSWGSNLMLKHGVLSWPVHDDHSDPKAKHHSGSDQAGCSSQSQSLPVWPFKSPSRNVGCHPLASFPRYHPETLRRPGCLQQSGPSPSNFKSHRGKFLNHRREFQRTGARPGACECPHTCSVPLIWSNSWQGQSPASLQKPGSRGRGEPSNIKLVSHNLLHQLRALLGQKGYIPHP